MNDATITNRRPRPGEIFMALAIALVLAATAFALLAPREPARATAAAAAAAPEDGQTAKLGPSGLPVPRFVSLKADITNIRRGPSSEHAVAFVYRRRGVPVEIIAEYEHWRRIRDSDGDEGWVYQSLLTGKRTVIIAPWKKDQSFALHVQPAEDAAANAMLQAGVIGEVAGCTGQWCEITVDGHDGWISQNLLFGVYPAEKIDG